MSDDTLPKAISESVLTIGGMRLRCYVLDDGRRIFDADDFNAFIDELGHLSLDGEEVKKLAEFAHGKEQNQ